jgi:hypothetical protein
VNQDVDSDGVSTNTFKFTSLYRNLATVSGSEGSSIRGNKGPKLQYIQAQRKRAMCRNSQT